MIFDRNIANSYFNQRVPCFHHNKNKNESVVTLILDKLWDRLYTILPTEKPHSTIGHTCYPFI
ncbi:MAG TPA: hypothetical protein VN704_10580 [Verrucomicrobiae bacterium]|nr:hypothetical protein [Verrucomicrobiae bacterium]